MHTLVLIFSAFTKRDPSWCSKFVDSQASNFCQLSVRFFWPVFDWKSAWFYADFFRQAFSDPLSGKIFLFGLSWSSKCLRALKGSPYEVSRYSGTKSSDKNSGTFPFLHEMDDFSEVERWEFQWYTLFEILPKYLSITRPSNFRHLWTDFFTVEIDYTLASVKFTLLLF